MGGVHNEEFASDSWRYNSELLLGIIIDDFRKQRTVSLNKFAQKQSLLLEQNKVCYSLVNKIAQYGCPSTNSQ